MTAKIDTIKKGLGLTLEQEQTLRANLPTWVPEKENVGTAMYQTATEYTVLIEEILARNLANLEPKYKEEEEKTLKYEQKIMVWLAISPFGKLFS